jgi:hypothetical protein
MKLQKAAELGRPVNKYRLLKYCNEVVVDERTLYSTINNLVSSWDMVVQYV